MAERNGVECLPGCPGWSEYGRRSSWWAIITYKVIKDIGRQRAEGGGRGTTAENDGIPGPGRGTGSGETCRGSTGGMVRPGGGR